MRSFAAAGLVMVLVGLGAYYGTGQLSWFSIANLVAGPVLVAVAAVVQVSRFRGFSGAHARRVVYRWAALAAALVAVIVGLNVALARWDTALDFTVERTYTLSDQTRQVCAELGGPVDLLLFEDSHLARDVRLLTRAYAAACPGIHIRELATGEAPPEAQALLETYEATVLVCREGRCEHVGFPSESNVTTALLRLTQTRGILVYFVRGHGEADLLSQTDYGFSGLADRMQREGLRPRDLVGPAHERIPDDATVLVAAGPQRSYLPAELAAIDTYLASGGRLLAFLEPDTESNLGELLERWGFVLPPGVVADAASSPLLEEPQPISLVVHGFNSFHDVTRKLSTGTMVLMPGARVVEPGSKPGADDDLQPLVFSSKRSWLERDVAGALGARAIAPGPDEPGGHELPVAAAGRYPRGEHEARIVVIGDRDFASNRFLGALYNPDLVLNALLWLAEDTKHISVRSKDWTPDQDPLTVHQTVAYFYFAAFVIPEVLLLLGIRAWARQRE